MTDEITRVRGYVIANVLTSFRVSMENCISKRKKRSRFQHWNLKEFLLDGLSHSFEGDRSVGGVTESNKRISIRYKITNRKFDNPSFPFTLFTAMLASTRDVKEVETLQGLSIDKKQLKQVVQLSRY